MLIPVWLGEAPRSVRSEAHEPPCVAFLFLGELFLIPHLLPIAAALARRANPPRIRLYVATSVHEEILIEALAKLRLSQVEIRRVRGFRSFPAGSRETPNLRSKVLLLALNAAAILRHDVAVVAERTSLWLPFAARRRGAAFVYNEHGAGPHANFRSRRNRYAARILMPGSGMAARVRESGHTDAPVVTVGYIKRDYIRDVSGSAGGPCFPERRPTIVYVPHWMRAKSSWWAMGESVLDYFARSREYNLIVAPHIRLAKFDAELEDRLRPYRNCPNIHIDTRSFRLIDQSYINGADIYLGDGSSQVVEFAETPRPVVFLNAHGIDWQSDPRFGHWQMGQVVKDVAGLDRALAEAPRAQTRYAPVQRAYVERMMGQDDKAASERAAEVVSRVLVERRARRALA
ncbi:hypothetical protein LK533_07760 [Sphingomonas sp. PL-96]|uniref:hypothetical protein n=1 Tax=Sphingomonas sp. PL-96 TaxID=2887201 RepID=UPI001E461E53|nr:hypothetical protein [Sphingomonas sp. PL-96]MCC2976569.1 hypothetical protein [Sphingomonas sp. PL-96]